ncbi:MAG: hypothetical protein HUJ16_03355 [Kangiella sp.]|nr:hypothetical protein [Kangiella sp.]
MKKSIEAKLSKQFDDLLASHGFSTLVKGRYFVRNMNNVFHVIQIVLDEGTSRSEEGYRLKLFADIWSPFLVQNMTELNSFPNDYDPLISGQVSKVRVHGNGFVDIDTSRDIDSGVAEVLQLVKSIVLPWFELFYDIKSTKNVLESLLIEVNERDISSKCRAGLNKKFPCIYPEDLELYSPSDLILDTTYFNRHILPVFRKKLFVENFKQQTSDGKEVFVKDLDSNSYCSISFELMDAAFMRVWVHIINPEMLPDGYWEQLSLTYIVPPLIGKPVDTASMCILRIKDNGIEAFISEVLIPMIKSLNSREGMITFIKGVIPGGLLGKSLDEVLAVLD